MAKEVAASPAPAAAEASVQENVFPDAGAWGPVESTEHGDYQGDDALYDENDIARRLEGDAGDDAAGEDEQPTGEDADEEAAATDAEEAGDDTGEGEESTDIPMPEGWEETVWKDLSDVAKQAVQAREQAHAQAMSQKAQEYTALQGQRDHLAVEANAQIQKALAALQAVVMADYQGVNWEQLAQADPATYVKLQRGFQQRMALHQTIQQRLAAATQQYNQQKAAELQQHMQGQFSSVEPELRAMYGAGYDPKGFAQEMATYMRGQGVPENVVNGLTNGYELKLVAKAMLYDKMRTHRAEAVKKVAQAPQVQAPRGPVVTKGNERAAKARALLNRNPGSTEALAAVLETL